MDVLYGWGILLSTNIKVNDKNILFAQYSYGHGIANYYVGYVGRQLDAVYDPISERMSLKAITGGFVTYTYMFNPSWRFSMTSGTSFIKGKDFEPDDTFRSSRYFASNVFFNPIETIRLGFEITTGSRTNLDLQKGNSTRLSFLASFDF
jgi:hypothetical protein